MPEDKKKKKLTPSEAHLQERLNIPGLGPFYPQTNPNLPPIEVPPMMRPQTKLIGLGQFEAQELEKLYNLAPQLRGRVPSITSGYGSMYVRDLLEQANSGGIGGYNAKRYLEKPTSLTTQGMTSLGFTSPEGSIEIGPHLDERDWVGTLAHEFQHALGLKRQNQIQNSPTNFKEIAIKEDPIVGMGRHGVNRIRGLNGLELISFGPETSDKLAVNSFYPETREDVNLPVEMDLNNPTTALAWKLVEQLEKKTGKRYPGKRPAGK